MNYEPVKYNHNSHGYRVRSDFDINKFEFDGSKYCYDGNYEHLTDDEFNILTHLEPPIERRVFNNVDMENGYYGICHGLAFPTNLLEQVSQIIEKHDTIYDFSNCKTFFSTEVDNKDDYNSLINEALAIGYTIVSTNRGNLIIEMIKQSAQTKTIQ
jgi:hypothetical protein